MFLFVSTILVFFSSQTVHFTCVLRHINNVNSTPPVVSRGEGHPAYLRIIMDQFVGFIANKDDITTNYTGEDVVLTVIDEKARKGSFVNLEVIVAFCLET